MPLSGAANAGASGRVQPAGRSGRTSATRYPDPVASPQRLGRSSRVPARLVRLPFAPRPDERGGAATVRLAQGSGKSSTGAGREIRNRCRGGVVATPLLMIVSGHGALQAVSRPCERRVGPHLTMIEPANSLQCLFRPFPVDKLAAYRCGPSCIRKCWTGPWRSRPWKA